MLEELEHHKQTFHLEANKTLILVHGLCPPHTSMF